MPTAYKIIGGLDAYYSNDGNFTVRGETVSDGYHTMDELYEHRLALFVALIRAYDTHITPLGSKVRCWKSKLHSDGTMYENYFIVGMSWPDFKGEKQISYHFHTKHWDKFKCIELPKAPPYDGHTSDDVIKRLLEL